MNELPGFFTPNAPNADERSFVRPRTPVELLVQDNVPLDSPMPRFQLLVEKTLGNQVETFFTGTDYNFIEKPGMNAGTKSYWARILPDELQILNGTYQVRALANDQEIFRTSLTVGYDRP